MVDTLVQIFLVALEIWAWGALAFSLLGLFVLAFFVSRTGPKIMEKKDW